MLGDIASQAGGLPYEQLITERLLRPLGMKHSAVYVNAEAPSGLASGYWPEAHNPIAQTPWSFGTSCAFAGLVSTAGDLALFLQAQMDEDEHPFLSRELRESLHTPRLSIAQGEARSMSTGWFIDPLPMGGLVTIGHGGELDGYSAVIAFVPKLRKGIVVLCNQGGSSAEQLAIPLLGELLKN